MLNTGLLYENIRGVFLQCPPDSAMRAIKQYYLSKLYLTDNYG